ncbi:MAG: deoxyribose-phosphate aldolase, partial [Acidimicrobiaceae bacterium]|nr:deoxyribose-phosphate aldolase [Acidimicrobiaceae bacterium]
AFPSGLSPLEVKVAEVSAAVADGATEIDTVLNRAAFLSGRHDLAAAELRALRKAAGSAHFKVILEVCELGSAAAVVEATRLAIDAGADMVKTSTGKGAAGASPAAVAAMAEAVAEHCAAGGRPVGIKVAGGVRTAADALEYLEIVRDVLGDGWLVPERLRFGASSLLGNVVAELVAC